MGFRFRRSVRILPGIHLNLSKHGTSWSFGRRGATVNVSKRGVKRTIGLPGTGLSYSEFTPAHHHDRPGVPLQPAPTTPPPEGFPAGDPAAAAQPRIFIPWLALLAVLALAWFLASR